jgi:hypothetical protein
MGLRAAEGRRELLIEDARARPVPGGGDLVGETGGRLVEGRRRSTGLYKPPRQSLEFVISSGMVQ